MFNEQLFFIKNALNVSNQEHEKLREKCAKFEYEYAAAKKRIKEAHNKQSW